MASRLAGSQVMDAGKAKGTAKKTVLVVEDDLQFSKLLAFYLHQEGYKPVRHYNGAGVVERACEVDAELITLDIMLPDVSGWDVLRALKSDPRTKEIPVLVISVLENSELAFSLGAVDYLTKPIDLGDLQTLLDRLAKSGTLPQHVTVLVVDDNVEMVGLLKEMLPAERYTLLAACDGRQGLTVARAKRPDVILLDLLMPEMDGFEMLEALRDDARVADIPVIVMTSKSVTAAEHRRLGGQTQGLMRKTTITPRSLLTQLRRLEMQALRRSR